MLFTGLYEMLGRAKPGSFGGNPWLSDGVKIGPVSGKQFQKNKRRKKISKMSRRANR